MTASRLGTARVASRSAIVSFSIPIGAGWARAVLMDKIPIPGGWYVHHNIFDWRREKCSNWRAQPHPQDTYTPHSPDGNSPSKIYNNLAIYGPDLPRRQA